MNPCLSVKKLKGGAPNPPWSWEAICLFRDTARADLWHAAALALYSGQRQGDALKMRRNDIRKGLIAVEQEKTGRNSRFLCTRILNAYWVARVERVRKSAVVMLLEAGCTDAEDHRADT